MVETTMYRLCLPLTTEIWLIYSVYFHFLNWRYKPHIVLVYMSQTTIALFVWSLNNKYIFWRLSLLPFHFIALISYKLFLCLWVTPHIYHWTFVATTNGVFIYYFHCCFVSPYSRRSSLYLTVAFWNHKSLYCTLPAPQVVADVFCEQQNFEPLFNSVAWGNRLLVVVRHHLWLLWCHLSILQTHFVLSVYTTIFL